jgi:SpoVK/Ycf46/Vps4 family AAA+-type ATPase
MIRRGECIERKPGKVFLLYGPKGGGRGMYARDVQKGKNVAKEINRTAGY